MSMLGANDYGKIDVMSSFMRAIVDRLCGLDHVLVTSSYMGYVEVIHANYRYG